MEPTGHPRAGPGAAGREEPRRHLVITGPGRSGTTLLVQLLDRLGVETGATSLTYWEHARAGLESNLATQTAPYVVKDPELSLGLRGLLDTGLVTPTQLDHVVVTIRDIDDAADSRYWQSYIQGTVYPRGGLWLANSRSGQRRILARAVYELLWTLAEYEIAHTLLGFPRFARDEAYAFRQLGHLLPDVGREEFRRAWEATVDPSLIHTAADFRLGLWRRVRWQLRPRTLIIRGLGIWHHVTRPPHAR